MKLKMYVIFDRQTEEYSNPMFMLAHGQAIRQFSDEVNRKGENNNLNKHPNDYTLHYIGDYETHTAQIEITDKIEQVAIAANLLEPTS